MKKGTKIKLMSGIAVLTIATGLTVSSPKNVYVSDIVTQIYGEEIIVDNQFVNAYIKTISGATEEAGNQMRKEYKPDTIIKDNNDLFELTEWIPTLEEVQENYVKEQDNAIVKVNKR